MSHRSPGTHTHTVSHLIPTPSTSPLIPHRQGHPRPPGCHVIQQPRRCDHVVSFGSIPRFSNAITVFVTTFPLIVVYWLHLLQPGHLASFSSRGHVIGWQPSGAMSVSTRDEMRRDRRCSIFNHSQNLRAGESKL